MADVRKIIEILIEAKNNTSAAAGAAIRDLERVETQSRKVGLAMIAIGTSGVAALAGMVASTIKAGEEFQNLSNRTGLSAQALSELKFVADQNESSIGAVAQSFKFLAVNATASKDATSEQAEAFRSIGVNALDAQGNVRDLGDLFKDVTTSMAGIENQAERTNVATKIFGRGSQELSGLLRLTREEFDAQIQKAHELGLTWTDEDVAAADDLGDSVEALKSSLGGLAKTVATPLVPLLTDFSESLQGVVTNVQEWAKENPLLAETTGKLSLALIGGGGLLFAISSISTALTAATGAASAFWLALIGPSGLATAAIIGVAGSIGLLLAQYQEQERLIRNAQKFGTGPVTITRTDNATAGGVPAGFAKIRRNGKEEVVTLEELNRLIGTAQVKFGALAEEAKKTPAEVKDLDEQLTDLNATIDAFSLPEKLRAARIELAQLRRSPEDIKFLEEDSKRVLRSIEQKAGLGGPAPQPRPGPGGGPANVNIPHLDLQDPLDQTDDLSEAAKQAEDSLYNMGEVGVSAAAEVGAGIGDITYNLLTGQQNAGNLGKVLVSSFASATAAIVAMIAQLVIVNSLLAVFSPGNFKGIFSGIGKIFGVSSGGIIEEGGVRRFAGGGVVTGGTPGRDSVLALLEPGEIVLPTSVTRGIRDGFNQPGEATRATTVAPSTRSYNITLSPLSGSHADGLALVRDLRRMLRELDGEYA